MIAEWPFPEEILHTAFLSQEVLGLPLVRLQSVVDGRGAVGEGARIVAAAPDRYAGKSGRAERARLGDWRIIDVRADIEAFQLDPWLIVDDRRVSSHHGRHHTAQ